MIQIAAVADLVVQEFRGGLSMDKQQAIKLFEILQKDAEHAREIAVRGDSIYYSSDALISAYSLAISVLKVLDIPEIPETDSDPRLRLKCCWFEHRRDLCIFVNDQSITSEQIQKITYSGRDTGCVLFYWGE